MSKELSAICNDPTLIFKQLENDEGVSAAVKNLLDPITKNYTVLDEIFIEGLDASQIWSQAKIVLDSVTEDLLYEKIPQLSAKSVNDDGESSEDSEGEQFSNIEDGNEDSGEEEINEEENQSEDIEDEDEGEQEEVEDIQDQKSNEELDDEFFSIDDFNKMTMELDKKDGEDADEDDEDDGDIDFFGEGPESDEDDEALYYNDFFTEPKNGSKKQTSFNKSSSEQKEMDGDQNEDEKDFNEDDYEDGMKSAFNDIFEDEEGEEKESKPKNLSSFEREQLRLQEEIAKLETEAIAEKKWAMKGESKAKDRPSDSLLNEDLDFERTAKPVPVITQEVTESLEEMIRRRIKEENFDDIPRRTLADLPKFKKSNEFQLSEVKSNKSLAELYEDDFKGDSNKDEVSEELQKKHDEITDLFKSLSYKLDALCSSYFIPKPAQKSLEVKTNASTITMEDAQPLTLSNAETLAPQEIFKASRSANENEFTLKNGIVLSRDELSREDKQRLRRANKRKRSKQLKAQDPSKYKKSKKQDVIDTLSKANNVTIINDKGEKRDVQGSLVKDKVKKGTTALKL